MWNTKQPQLGWAVKREKLKITSGNASQKMYPESHSSLSFHNQCVCV